MVHPGFQEGCGALAEGRFLDLPGQQPDPLQDLAQDGLGGGGGILAGGGRHVCRGKQRDWHSGPRGEVPTKAPLPASPGQNTCLEGEAPVLAQRHGLPKDLR